MKTLRTRLNAGKYTDTRWVLSLALVVALSADRGAAQTFGADTGAPAAGPCPLVADETGVCVPRVGGRPDIASLGPRGDTDLPGFTRVEGFTQRTPTDGAPAAERTVVYLGHDGSSLHVVFAAHDRTPGAIRARMVPRENTSGDDVVTLMLDTDDDSRRAYVFRSNPLGIQWDALFTERQGFDRSFDAVWGSEGRVTGWGYVVRMEIPFKSLRFPPTPEQRWRIVLSRQLARGTNEDTYWPRVSLAVEGTLTQSAPLTGLRDISPGRNLQVIPYTSFRSFRAVDPRAPGGPRSVTDLAEPDAGLDFKAIIDDRFVLDVTANPDFSQVESDLPQVTVNQRFEVFFPERRPFFNENADYFQTPIALLFTRRIQDPQVGTRFTGKAGGWGLGGLLIDDQAPGKRAAPGSPLEGERAWFGATRVSRDIGEHSTVGGMFVGRELDGDHNRVGALDARFRIDDHWTTSGQFALSGTERDGETVSAPAFTASLSRSDRRLTLFGSYSDFDPDFEAQAGFVPRTGIRRLSHFSSFFWRPDEKALVSWGPEFFFQRIWDHDGTLLDEITEGSLEWNFLGNTSLEVNYRRSVERLRPIDHGSIVEIRAYDTDSWDLEYSTSIFDWFSIGGNYRLGKQINFNPPDGAQPETGDWRQLNFNLSLRPVTRLRIDNSFLWTLLDEPTSDGRIFDDRIFRTRWNWQWNRELSLRAIVQWEHTETDPLLTTLDTRKNLNGDLLVTYRLNPWTAVYAGFNTNARNEDIFDVPGADREIRTTDDLRTDATQFFLKMSYLLRF